MPNSLECLSIFHNFNNFNSLECLSDILENLIEKEANRTLFKNSEKAFT